MTGGGEEKVEREGEESRIRTEAARNCFANNCVYLIFRAQGCF